MAINEKIGPEFEREPVEVYSRVEGKQENDK